MRWSYAAAASAALLFAACKLVTIRVNDEATTTIEKGTVLEALIDDVGFGEFIDMDITAAQELQNQGAGPGDIQDVRLEYLSLEAVAGSPDLSFLNTLDVYVESPDLPRVLIASAPEFPEGQALVELQIEDVDLTDYAVSQSMTFDTEVNGSRPEEDTDVKLAFGVAIGVTTQGACGGGGEE